MHGSKNSWELDTVITGTAEMIKTETNTCSWEPTRELQSQDYASDYLIERRAIACQRLIDQGLPTFANEDWKYTNLAPYKEVNFSPSLSSQCSSVILNKLNPLHSDACIQIVNGLIRFDQLPKITGVNFFRLSDLPVQFLDQLKQSLNSDPHHCFAEDLAWANAQQALCIHITSQAVPKVTLQLQHVLSESGIAAHALMFMLVDAAVHCRLVESFENPVGAALSNNSVRIMMQESACLTHLRLLEQSNETLHLSCTTADLAASANYTCFTGSFGAKLTRNELRCRLLGSGAHANLLGANALTGTQHVDSHTVLDHVAPHCTSLEIYKGIYAERSKGVFDGTIIVRPDAQKTNAIQSSRALLLSPDASSYSKPQLKIWADDVRCTHGAAVGQIDEQALFYLRSRGIPLDLAMKMLSKAFIAEVSRQIPDQEMLELVDVVESKYLDQVLDN